MFSIFSRRSKTRKTQRQRAAGSLPIEQLERRYLLSTFTVSNLDDSGAGSLRQAVLDANQAGGADTIDFTVAGTIQLTTGALATITDTVSINGTTAPGYAGSPKVQIDFNGFQGLQFDTGSDGSSIRALGIGNASFAGLSIHAAGNITIAGNYIGVDLSGAAAFGNQGWGIQMTGTAGNIIGGVTAADSNVISANLLDGISASASANNQILGNAIGTDITGTIDLGNGGNGMELLVASPNNFVQGNVISGNHLNGILLGDHSSGNTITGNLIGLTTANTVLGNHLDGVSVRNADGNLIGHADPVTGVTYYDATGVPTLPVSGWQGIRGTDTDGVYLLAGTSTTNGLLYVGNIEGTSGTSYAVNFPGAYNTSVYGPDNAGGTNVRLVGSYKNPDYQTSPVTVHGFLYQGDLADLGSPGHYVTIDHPDAQFNYVHSTMGGLVVGNYDSTAQHGQGGAPLGPGHAYLYDIAQGIFLTDITYPGSTSNSAYGIWWNGGTSYTIVGGYSNDTVNNFADQDQPLGNAFMVDYDSHTGEFSNWASFSDPRGVNFVTHFEGISSVVKGVYTLSADSVQIGTGDPAQGSFVEVDRNADGTFGPAKWVNLNYTGLDPTTNITSSNSVYGNQVVGIVIGTNTMSYQATVNASFQESNVISGNGANGVGIYASNDNQVAMNFIGTDISGTLDRGNAMNGVRISNGASRNLIGGAAQTGNDPTNGVFVRPPQGNLISGNTGYGVLIDSEATQNQLSGNFIGTAVTGISALGNDLDGVSITNANANALIGCTVVQDPFVFYNVIGGNGGNGLTVHNSNDTTIQANFFGLGADNDTPVGNHLNGVVISGTSTRITMGGVIPLGNVVAANAQNGIVLRDSVSYYVSFNSFVGLAAFTLNSTLGNGQDGMLVTATGGHNIIRTSVISANHDDGIDVRGAARDFRIADDIIGLNTNGSSVMGNYDNGIEISEAASDITVGGFTPDFSIIPRNIISGNGNNGVAILAGAHDITVNGSSIGTDVQGTTALANVHDGVFIGTGAYSNTIGSTDPLLQTTISGNGANGVELQGTSNNIIQGSYIGVDRFGGRPMGNGGNGVLVNSSNNNVIGGTAAGSANLIAYNLDGVFIQSGSGNGIHSNTIILNSNLGIDLGPNANAQQAAPVLNSVVPRQGGIVVAGSLTSVANSTFTLEFFANSMGGSSGRYFLGVQTVRTNGLGVANFTFFGPSLPLGNNYVTATATGPGNNTSEFSAAVTSQLT